MHSDVLKNIMIHCSNMTLDCFFSHAPAHQDDRRADIENLSRQSQLNCAADFGVKRLLLSLNPDDLPKQQAFPLKAISVWAGKEKIMMSDTGSSIIGITCINTSQGKNLTLLGYCHFNSLIK